MKILPSLRDKKRYLAFEVISEHTIKRQELSREIQIHAGSLFGDTGCSEMNLQLLSFDGRYGIIRCAHKRTLETRAALACVNNVRGGRVTILVMGISGTVKGAMEKFIQKIIVKETEQESKELLNRHIQFQGIVGKVIKKYNNEIDIIPDNPQGMETVNRSNTRYIGITVFDIKEMI